MKLADWFIRVVVVATFVSLLIPSNRFALPMGLFALFVTGLWATFYPAGVIGWLKTAHPELDTEDRSLWWVPRFIGIFFICFALLLLIAFRQ